MARKPRIAQTEHPYHATIRTNNKEFRFNKEGEQRDICKIFADSLLKASQKYGVAVLHFVLMATHFHLIVKTPEGNISLFMQYINSRVAEKMNKLHRRTGHLWGERFKSTIIDTGIYMQRVLRYIYGNPVRAKIVETSLDYENSTVFFYAFGRPAFVQITGKDEYFLSLGETDEERREKFVQCILGISLTIEELAETRTKIKSFAYGSDQFLYKIKEMYSKHKTTPEPLLNQAVANVTDTCCLN